MKICATIAEFNPFHNGHKYFIEALRQHGATHIIAVMSGNYVQRGECAVFSKWDRTRLALQGGVDLLIEIPTPWAASTAQKFAFGAVSLINSLGCSDEIAFGSECGDIQKLSGISDALFSAQMDVKIKDNLSFGLTYAAAREQALTELYGEQEAALLRSPNNILAVEYLNALKMLNMDMQPFTVKRFGAAHDSHEEKEGILSAGTIRQKIDQGIVPEQYNGLNVYSMKYLERAVLARLRTLNASDYKDYADVSEGLENRICDGVAKAESLADLYDLIKTKRYTHARIRRILLAAFLDIQKDIQTKEPPYLKILGFNEKGRETLRILRDTAKKPVLMKAADRNKLDIFGREVYDLEVRCTDLFSLACHSVQPCGLEKTQNIILL